MLRIGVPMQVPELDLKPEPTGGIELSEDMQQVLASLTGFWLNKRVLLKASPSGILFASSPQLKGIKNVAATAPNFPYQGENIPCSEVVVIAHPDNANRIWVNVHAAAAADTGIPLDAGDPVGFGITNLNMLQLLIVANGEKAIIAYTE